MSLTNFGKLTPEQITVHRKELHEQYRLQSFFHQRFGSTGTNSPVQIVKDLKETLGGGMKCTMSLVPDLISDGGVGSAGGKREGNEERMAQYFADLLLDELYHAVRNEGVKLYKQNSVVDFRKEAKDKLAYWRADRMDQLCMLTLSGISYAYNTNGSARTEDTFSKLLFAPASPAPSAKRHRRWITSTGLLGAGATGSVAATDVPSYKMLVAMRAYAKANRIRPLKSGGKDYYIVLMHPVALAMLKNDSDYKTAVITGGLRGDDNPWFTGMTAMVDGMIIYDHEYVYNTNGTATKWGAGNAVNGTRTLLLGAQALGMAELDAPDWVEKKFEFDSQEAIYSTQITGMTKPQFYSNINQSVEDFGVLAVDHALDAY